MDPESDSQRNFLLYIFFGGLECVGHSFAYVARPFCIFERCLYSNPENCRSKQARYVQLSHYLPYLATYLPLKLVKFFHLI